MRKIFSSLVVVTLIGALTISSTLALLRDTGEVKGLSVAAGNADIKLAGYYELATNTFLDSLDYSAASFFPKLYPGFGTGDLVPQKAIDLHIKNASTADISLKPTIKLTNFPGGWGNNLTYAVQILIQDKDSGNTTGWMSLPQWVADVELPGAPISKTVAYRTYYIYVRIPYTYGADEVNYVGGPAQGTEVGNEIANLELNLGGFTITGTQVP